MQKLIFPIWFFFVFTVLEAFEKIDWQKAKPVQKGVLHIALALEQPRLMKINMLRIDLKTPGLDFTATGRDKDWGKPMPDYPEGIIRTKRQRTRNYMKEARKAGINMIVAVNAAPWGPWRKPFNQKYADPGGIHILNGEVISDHGGKRPAFVIYSDGTPAITQGIPKEDYSRIKLSLTGFSIVVRNGKSSFKDKSIHPRTLYGFSADKRYLYLLTIDGRQKDWSIGASAEEGGELLIAAGASEGINMDGGGSSTLIYWDETQQKQVSLCRHSANGYERPVGSNMGIFLRK